MTGGTETEGFESEAGSVPPWPVTGPEPDTDAMSSLLPELPSPPVRLRDRLEAMLSEAAETEAGSDDADLAAFMLSVLHAVEVAVSSRLRAERWRTP